MNFPVVQKPYNYSRSKSCVVILFTATLHLLLGILLLTYGNEVQSIISATLIDTFYGIPQLAGIACLIAAFLAALPFWRIFKKTHLVYLLMPQQLLVWLSAFGAVRAIWLGMYADGVVRSQAFIFADQLPLLLLACFQTIVIFLVIADL